ncbi:MAG: hypothetical protein U9Q67_04780, partial [Patescibacteria group bacterium]|nr:hypothetical protein [Patescibacteria group bacterium]
MTDPLNEAECGDASSSEVAELNQIIPLPSNATLTIGSGETASIQIENDNTVESDHVLLAATDQGVVVRDISESGNSNVLIGKQKTSLVDYAGRIVQEGAFIEIGDNTLLRVTRRGKKGWGLKQVPKKKIMDNLLLGEFDFHQRIIEIIWNMGIDIRTVDSGRDLQGLRLVRSVLANRKPAEVASLAYPTTPVPEKEIINVEPEKPIKLPSGKTVVLGKKGHIQPSRRDRKVEKEHLHLASTSDGVIAKAVSSKNEVGVYVGGHLSKLPAQKPVRIPDGAVIKLGENTFYCVTRGKSGGYELVEFTKDMAKFVKKSAEIFMRFEEEVFWYSIARELRNFGLAVPYWNHGSDRPLSLGARISEAIKTPQPRNVPPDFIWPPGKEDVVETLQPDNAVVISSESSPEHGNQD